MPSTKSSGVCMLQLQAVYYSSSSSRNISLCFAVTYDSKRVRIQLNLLLGRIFCLHTFLITCIQALVQDGTHFLG